MREAPGRPRHISLLALDIGVCVVLLGFVVSFLTVRRNLHQYNADAGAIAAWAKARGLDRIAWPEDKREAVPALLAADVTPVLVPTRVPPQQLAVNMTTVLVTSDPSYLEPFSTGVFQTGPFTARAIDLAKASRVPIANGEQVGEQISRPYIYSPLRKATRIPAPKPWRTQLTLSAGHYVLTVALFDPQAKAVGTVTATATPAKRPLGTRTAHLLAGVLAPMRIDFDVTETSPVVVDLGISVTGPVRAAASGFLHEWELQRQDAAS